MLDTPIDVRASGDTFREHSGFTQYHNQIPMWKSKHDLNRYRTILERTQPDLVIETGTRWGGFASWMADQFGCQVVTVDIAADLTGAAASHPRVTYVEGSSVDFDTIMRVSQAIGDHQRVMVVLDADHHAYHVGCEIEAYRSFVSVGCYLVVEDALADYLPADEQRRFGRRIPEEGGPLPAIEATLLGDLRFERDLEIEGMSSISHSPAGWWRRIS